MRGRSPPARRQPQPDRFTREQAGTQRPGLRWVLHARSRVGGMHLFSSQPLPGPVALNLSLQPRSPRLQGESTGSSRCRLGWGGVRVDTAFTNAREHTCRLSQHHLLHTGSQMSTAAWEPENQVATAPYPPLKVIFSFPCTLSEP